MNSVIGDYILPSGQKLLNNAVMDAVLDFTANLASYGFSVQMTPLLCMMMFLLPTKKKANLQHYMDVILDLSVDKVN